MGWGGGGQEHACAAARTAAQCWPQACKRRTLAPGAAAGAEFDGQALVNEDARFKHVLVAAAAGREHKGGGGVGVDDDGLPGLRGVWGVWGV